MADIKNIQVDGVEYAIKDETARNRIGDLNALATPADDLVTAINAAAQTGGGGECNIQRIESDSSNYVYLKDLASGVYILYGYFRPFNGSGSRLTFDNILVSVAADDTESHILALTTINSKVDFFTIKVDSTQTSGYAYTRTNISLMDLYGLLGKVGDLSELTTTATESLVAAINELVQAVPTKVSELENDSGYLTEQLDISGKADKSGLTLGIHTDGLIYLFVDGSPVGTGIELPTGGGDVYGYVDSENNIVLTGALADGTYNIKYEMEDGSTIDIGDMVLDSNTYYSVANNLTNCVSSNSAAQVVEGGSYSATITANSGYELESVVVTMGGTDISSTAVSGGNIGIEAVTGDIMITAVAEALQAVAPVIQSIPLTAKASITTDAGASRENTAGHAATDFIDVSNIPKPCTIDLVGAGWVYADLSGTGYVRFYIEDVNGSKLAGGYTHPDRMPSGVTVTVGELANNGNTHTDASVTITSDNIGKLRFAGIYTAVTPDAFDANVTKATLTYTPLA